MLFPCPDNEAATPMEFVPKRSNVMSIIQCGGVWVGGKGWGLTWKLTQCVVKPMVMESVLGGLRLNITPEQSEAMNKEIPKSSEEPVVEEEEEKAPVNTYVQDSDDEEPVKKPEPVKEAEPVKEEVVAEPEPVKKEVVAEPEPAAKPAPVKKKVVKKKSVA